jgi:hypothetical protein
MFEAEAMRARTPVGKYYALGGGIVVLLLVVVQLLAYFAAMRLPPAAGAWQLYRSQNKVIAFTGPATWHFTTHGVSGVGEPAELIGGSLYSVTLNGSQIASILSDVFGAAARSSASLQNGGTGSPPLERRQEGRLHTFLAAQAKRDDPNYQEEGGMQPTNFAGGAAAYSDYTTRHSVGLMSVPMKGRRLTAPLTDLAFEIRLECPAAHWDEFEPRAQKILDSAAQTHGL